MEFVFKTDTLFFSGPSADEITFQSIETLRLTTDQFQFSIGPLGGDIAQPVTGFESETAGVPLTVEFIDFERYDALLTGGTPSLGVRLLDRPDVEGEPFHLYYTTLIGAPLPAPAPDATVLDFEAQLGTVALSYDFSSRQPVLDPPFGEGQTYDFRLIRGFDFLGPIGPDVDEGRAELIALLYEAALDRNGNIDAPGLNFWINAAAAGLNNLELAGEFADSPEFTASFGTADSLSDPEFIGVLYQNVLDREIDVPGFEFWVGRLAAVNGDRAQLLLAFAESTENREGSPFIEQLTETDPGIWEFVA